MRAREDRSPDRAATSPQLQRIEVSELRAATRVSGREMEVCIGRARAPTGT